MKKTVLKMQVNVDLDFWEKIRIRIVENLVCRKIGDEKEIQFFFLSFTCQDLIGETTCALVYRKYVVSEA